VRKQDRRQFLATTLAGAGYMLAAPGLAFGSFAAARSFQGSDLVELGKTGIKTSRLAFGTGFNGGGQASDHTRLGRKAFDELIRHGVDQGVVFLDTADLYGSHTYLKSALKGIPREKYALLSKIWPRRENWLSPSGGAKAEVDRFRQELNADVIDVCLIHCMMSDDWPETHKRIRDELSELKQRGVVRAVGVSCHDFGALKVAANHPWVDLLLARINHKGGRQYSMDASLEEVTAVLKTARSHGKAIVGMKIFGAGKLVQPDEKDASLKYVFKNDLVDAITIGMLSRQQVDDTMECMSRIA
jgi:1-deoxyxylulose-5-phosphate synthase